MYCKFLSVALAALAAAWYTSDVLAESSPFVRVEFAQGISMEVPRNWSYKDDVFNAQLDTSSEAIIRLKGTASNPGKNVILIAGSGLSRQNTPAATLRLSVRLGPAPTQQGLKQLQSLSNAEIQEALGSVAKETERTLVGSEYVKSAKTVRTGVVSNQFLVCMIHEMEVSFTDDDRSLQQTYVCPTGGKSVKVSTSYRMADAVLFKPIVDYVWKSLRVRD